MIHKIYFTTIKSTVLKFNILTAILIEDIFSDCHATERMNSFSFYGTRGGQKVKYDNGDLYLT
jgi:hypothetical protein